MENSGKDRKKEIQKESTQKVKKSSQKDKTYKYNIVLNKKKYVTNKKYYIIQFRASTNCVFYIKIKKEMK